MLHGRSALATIIAPILLSACQSYQPVPVNTRTTAQTLDGRQLALPADRPAAEADLLAAGISYSPTVRNALAAWRTAVAAGRSARVRPLGTLTLTAEYSHQDNPNKPWLGSGAIAVPLDMGARRAGRIDGADLAALQARYDYVEALWTLRTAIRRSVADLAAARAELLLDREAAALRSERERRMEHRVAAGEDARAMALQARTDRIAAERRLADAQARATQALAVLAEAIGVPPRAIEPASFAPPATIPALPARSELATIRSEAALARPDVLRAVADYDLAESALRTEVAKQYPDIQIGPGYTYERGITKLPFSLSLALPPSDFNRAAIREAETRRSAAATRLEGTQAAVLAAVDRTAAAVMAAADSERRTRGQDVPVAAKALDQARHSLALGEGDRTDELAAHAALVDAQIAAADAHRLLALARVDFDDAARPPLDPAEGAIFDAAMKTLETQP